MDENINQSEINVNSLWIFQERDKSGKHRNIYQGNFIPQIPNQLLRRFTKEGDVVFEPFMGSGTTLFECETLKRKYIGFDINEEIIDYVNKMMNDNKYNEYYYTFYCNSLDSIEVDKNLIVAQNKLNFQKLQFILFHPPYMNIIKFTDNKSDLSQINNIQEFVKHFKIICENSLKYLENNKYFAVVIGDIYKNGEVLPLGFYCMDMIKRNFKVKLKGIVIKNIEGNKAKIGKEDLWKKRALNSDYYIFKHEYIYVFKKEE